MLRKIIKSFFIVLLISVLMLLLVGRVTRTVQYQNLLAFPAYFCLTLFTLKILKNKLPEVYIAGILFVSMILMHSYSVYLCFVESLFPVPSLLAYCLGTISALLYYKLKRPINFLPLALSGLFIIFMFFQGWDYWLHKMNFGTFTGEVAAYNLPAKFESFAEQKNPITENDFNNKIVLLDFWTTTCGICFQKFPQLQTAYDKYKNDSSVIILAVNTSLEEDKPNQAFDAIRKREYTFPVVITLDENLAEKFGVKGYPTTFVINPIGQVVYKGDIEGAIKIVDELKSNAR